MATETWNGDLKKVYGRKVLYEVCLGNMKLAKKKFSQQWDIQSFWMGTGVVIDVWRTIWILPIKVCEEVFLESQKGETFAIEIFNVPCVNRKYLTPMLSMEIFFSYKRTEIRVLCLEVLRSGFSFWMQLENLHAEWDTQLVQFF